MSFRRGYRREADGAPPRCAPSRDPQDWASGCLFAKQGFSQVEEQRKPSAWTDTPVSNAADQRLDGSAERTSLNPILGAPADPVQPAGTSYELSPEPQITAGSEQPDQ